MLPKNFVTLSFFACIIVYLIGMFNIPLMDIDAAQYASISREMLERKSFLQVYDLGKDYLDKPPMLFWLSALSMQIFGVYDWAYRLPSFCFGVLAIYSTYKLALLFYKKEIAIISALVLASSQAMFLINHDVRTDTMLMGWVIFSIWQLAAWYQFNKWYYFVVGFLAIAGGMLTKGPIALMVPAFAFVPHFILRREWKQLFRVEYILGILLISIALLPMSYGLYEQFDKHPGKIINGDAIQSGLKFYYWTQSFGRYTGENHFKEMNDFTFLLQNMLWSFLPWIIFFLIALVMNTIHVIRNRFYITRQDEFITTGGFIVTYCILGRSQAQLPHYIFIVYPLAAIVTAQFLYKLCLVEKIRKLSSGLLLFHLIVFLLLWLLVAALLFFPFQSINKFIIVLPLFGLIGLVREVFWHSKNKFLIIRVAVITIVGINFLLNCFFYPALLQYEKGYAFYKFVNEHTIDKNKVVQLNDNIGYSFHFYSKHIYKSVQTNQLQKNDYVIIKEDSLVSIKHRFPSIQLVTAINSFSITQLTLPFLNPATRKKELTKNYLVFIQ
jgi:4-amino-4-deoxy-L-arabinose transferase-like glycosyltransferase